MNTEIEAKWLDIDHDKFREKLRGFGARQTRPKTKMRRAVFDLPGKKGGKEWARLRDEGDKITMSYKRTDNQSLTGTKEICLVVDDFAAAVEFLIAAGFRRKSFQETRRESWELDGAEIELDEWPWLPTFVEIETKSVEQMEQIAAKLGFDLKDAMYAAADLVYNRYYDVTPAEVNRWTEIKFGDVPEWLEVKRRKND